MNGTPDFFAFLPVQGKPCQGIVRNISFRKPLQPPGYPVKYPQKEG